MTTTKRAPKQTAAECYATCAAESQDLLKRITNALAQHQREQAETPSHWTHAGSLDDINRDLAYVLARLGDRSAVDAKGMEY